MAVVGGGINVMASAVATALVDGMLNQTSLSSTTKEESFDLVYQNEIEIGMFQFL